MINELGLSEMSYATLVKAYENALKLGLNQEFLQLLEEELERRNSGGSSDPSPSL